MVLDAFRRGISSGSIIISYMHLSQWMKKAVVLSTDPDLEELESLLATLKVEIVERFVQKISRPHTTSYLGPGKIDEIEKKSEDLDFDIIVVNGVLRPSQHHFLEMKFQKECIDRPGVILRIFANHAHSPEAIAQVTLAKLRYELPFLREWIHKAKSGDRPGFLAGGAYATDVYYEHAKTHARKIEKSLSEVSARRETARSKRKSKGFSLVSLAGHTNAGKSALLNALCGSQVEVDNRMFSTLSTTTRLVSGSHERVLVTDTVGFIRNLPPDLVDAFNSTLEEIYHADQVLLVFDLSEKENIVIEKLNTSLKILLREIEPQALLLVGNKIDLLSEQTMERVCSLVSVQFKGFETFFVSARTSAGLEPLRERLVEVRDFSYQLQATVPQTDQVYSLLSRLRSICRIYETSTGPSLSIEISCKGNDAQKIEAWIKSVGGTVISSSNSTEGTSQEVPQEAKGSPSMGRAR